MAFPIDNLQDDHFYGGVWSKPMTLSLVSCLVTQRELGNWVWNSSNLDAITVAYDQINQEFNTDLKGGEVLACVKFLRNRFNIFEHMISCSGVAWDRSSNYVFAAVEQWRSWRTLYPLSKAYMTSGEPLYDGFKLLFKPDEGAAPSDNIIVIPDSDDDEPNADPVAAAPILAAAPVAAAPVLALPAAAAPIEVVEISDDDEEVEIFSDEEDNYDSDIDIDGDSEDDVMDEVALAGGEVINDEDVKDSEDSDSGFDTPTAVARGPRLNWSNVIPRYNQGSPNISSSSSPSLLKPRRIFK